MRISDWSSDVCSSDLFAAEARAERALLVRVVQRDLGLEEVAQRQRHAGDELAQQEAAQTAVHDAHRSGSSRHECGNRSKANRTPAGSTNQNKNGRAAYKERVWQCV